MEFIYRRPGCRTGQLRIRRLSWLISVQLIAASTIPYYASAQDYFNPALLQIGNPHRIETDLSVFESNDAQPPGVYHVDVLLNKQLVDTRDVTFTLSKASDGKARLLPCLSIAELSAMGIKTELFPLLVNKQGQCANLSAIPDSSTEFIFSKQQLLLGIPQAAIEQNARDYISPSQWDNGIPALLLNYSASGANSYVRSGKGNDNSSQYVNLRPGINIGDWRLRNYTTWGRSSGERDKWNTVYTYAQRNIVSIKGQLTLGDSSAPADIFDSVSFRGVQIASDDDMLPNSLKGYAPVVRGIARTNAQVVVRQNGYVIYQSYVPPGAFEISDMYPTGGSGDLYVTIKEADGTEQHQVVPFASLPVMQREGRFKYSLTGGQYRSYDSAVDTKPFAQATAIYGLPWSMTLYGGGQVASPYQSVALGVGKNLGDFGALSVDVTQAWSQQRHKEQENGQSWRVRYSKNLVETGTNFAIAGYRYSTAGYYSLQEVLDTYRSELSMPLIERRRNRAELTMNQNLWEGAGSLSLSLISEDYWNSKRRTQSLSAGYNNSWQGVSYGFNYTYNRNSVSDGTSAGSKYYDKDQIIALNVSVPLSRWMGNTYASYNLNSSKKGSTTQNIGLNGTALADNNLSWNVQTGHASKGQGNSGNLNADYRGTYGEVIGGYGYTADSSRLNYGLQGGIIAHPDGVTLGQPLGETVALIKAKGASGVSVNNQTGVRTDWRGYAIVPYISPYRKNTLSLNTETLAEDADLTETSKNTVPSRGAVVELSYQAQIGARVLMTLLQNDGTPVPFGAIVTDPAMETSQSFIVGDRGQVYLTGLSNNGKLLAQWGKEAGRQCRLEYILPSLSDSMSGIQMINGKCLR